MTKLPPYDNRWRDTSNKEYQNGILDNLWWLAFWKARKTQ